MIEGTGVTDGGAMMLMIVFGAFTVLLVRSREMAWWQAALVFLFGIYTALTPVVFTVTELVSWVLARLV
ncbi:hypothetical protein [Streptomyces odontomachi]|uniref:hypothetical protein n=1 Tax=Streptomyces odontomachi TaxID=2944940 RepID=UPI00210E5605|nr:hypothetical protein [Streptomyces sp. ODS25]